MMKNFIAYVLQLFAQDTPTDTVLRAAHAKHEGARRSRGARR